MMMTMMCRTFSFGSHLKIFTEDEHLTLTLIIDGALSRFFPTLAATAWTSGTVCS